MCCTTRASCRRWPSGAAPGNRILIDRDFEAGDEPVKVCVQDGIPVELRKQVAAGPALRHHR